MMKKFCLILMALLLCLSIVACQKDEIDSPSDTEAPTEAPGETTSDTVADTNPPSGGNSGEGGNTNGGGNTNTSDEDPWSSATQDTGNGTGNWTPDYQLPS